jgi:branched-subunit amino acid transport protein
MTTAWSVVIALGLGTYVLKAAGPLLVGGRRLPPAIERLADNAPAALLAALVATSVFTDGTALVVDARIVGLGVAAVALWRRVPFVVVVLLAAAATALVRALAT